MSQPTLSHTIFVVKPANNIEASDTIFHKPYSLSTFTSTIASKASLLKVTAVN